ncbi:MAG: hypothetical protein GXP35_16960, partial [Actinobacteria bacterium]|nr:hypothetical protein [Actinomycetota bacterium]
VTVATGTTDAQDEPTATTVAAEPVVESPDQDDQAAALIIVTGPVGGSGSSTTLVWTVLVGLNLAMITAVLIRRRLRRSAMIGLDRVQL